MEGRRGFDRNKGVSKIVKVAMPVSFMSDLFTSYSLTIFKHKTYSRKYEKLPNIVIYARKHITETMIFFENGWPANSSLFISTHCVQTDKKLDYNHYS